jgi:hypothetical protein
MTTLATANFNDTLPVSPTAGDVNIKWQADPPTTAPRNISAYVQNLGGVEARSGTSEAVTDKDCGWLLEFTNASPVAVTLGETGEILTLGANGDGSGYAASDTFTIAGGTGGSGHVVAVASGVPTAVAIDSKGHGYSATSSAATTATSGGGSGMHVSIGTVTGNVRATFVCAFYVPGAGGATLTPQSGLINGAANLSVGTGSAGWLFWDGTNWEAVMGGGSGTVTHTAGALTSGQLILGNGGADIKVGDLTGDVTTSGSTATTLANIPNDVPMAGDILATNTAAPATPASGKERFWTDSTDKRLHDKNDAGTIGTTVVKDTGATHNFLTAISAAGVISKAQPAAADLSDGTTGSGGAVVLATGPTLSNPVVGTQSPGDNTTKAASTAFVTAAISAIPASFTPFGESFSLSVGATTCTLTHTPNPASFLMFFRNGLLQRAGVDFAVSGTAISSISPAAVSGDLFDARYTY